MGHPLLDPIGIVFHRGVGRANVGTLTASRDVDVPGSVQGQGGGPVVVSQVVAGHPLLDPIGIVFHRGVVRARVGTLTASRDVDVPGSVHRQGVDVVSAIPRSVVAGHPLLDAGGIVFHRGVIPAAENPAHSRDVDVPGSVQGQGAGLVKVISRAIVAGRPLLDPIGIVFYRGVVIASVGTLTVSRDVDVALSIDGHSAGRIKDGRQAPKARSIVPHPGGVHVAGDGVGGHDSVVAGDGD